MLSEGVRKEAYESHRYSRSQSDCNGTTMQSALYTDITKQIEIPLQTTRSYLTEISLKSTIREENSSTTDPNVHEKLTLAQEIGNDVSKSLVQQRIESLYGKTSQLHLHKATKGATKVNGVHHEEIDIATTPAKNHIGSVSPPVFRHLNKDFRKQLQLSSSKPSTSQSASNESPKISNGHDECDRVKSLTPPPLKSNQSVECMMRPNQEREGYHYLQLIDTEKEKIREQVAKLECETGVPEEASGKIRAACGKANLLMAQKFEQFRGLCWKNIEEKPSMPFYTTSADLAGFWDLVMLQVEDISATFREIWEMKENGWKETPTVFKKPNPTAARIRHNANAVTRSNPSTPKRSSKSTSEAHKAREEARKQLLAAKKKGRQQAAAKEEEVAIFVPASSSS